MISKQAINTTVKADTHTGMKAFGFSTLKTVLVFLSRYNKSLLIDDHLELLRKPTCSETDRRAVLNTQRPEESHIRSQADSLQIVFYSTRKFSPDLCLLLHLLHGTIRGQGSQQLGYPGAGALCLGAEVIALPLQAVLGVGQLLQSGLQLLVALRQVVGVLQEALRPNALSAH